jgi:hypothetical protein
MGASSSLSSSDGETGEKGEESKFRERPPPNITAAEAATAEAAITEEAMASEERAAAAAARFWRCIRAFVNSRHIWSWDANGTRHSGHFSVESSARHSW